MEKHGIFGNLILENNLVELSLNTFPQRNLCLANILDGMIDQLRRGGRLVSALNPFPGFIFYVLQYIVQPVNKIVFVLLDNIKAFQK